MKGFGYNIQHQLYLPPQKKHTHQSPHFQPASKFSALLFSEKVANGMFSKAIIHSLADTLKEKCETNSIRHLTTKFDQFQAKQIIHTLKPDHEFHIHPAGSEVIGYRVLGSVGALYPLIVDGVADL